MTTFGSADAGVGGTDVRDHLRQVRAEILRGVSICFTKVIPLGDEPTAHFCWKLAIKVPPPPLCLPEFTLFPPPNIILTDNEARLQGTMQGETLEFQPLKQALHCHRNCCPMVPYMFLPVQCLET